MRRRVQVGQQGAARAGRPVALMVAAAMTLVGCVGAGNAYTGDGAPSETATPEPGPAVITVEPNGDGAPAAPGSKVTVRVTSGRLSEVKVTATDTDTDAFAGALSKDRRTWTSTALLGPGKTYAVLAEAVGADGERVTKRSTLTTREVRETFVGEYSPEKGAEVGVAMPVSIVFNKPIRNKAAVERGLSVTASPAVEGSWSWVEDTTARTASTTGPRSTGRPAPK